MTTYGPTPWNEPGTTGPLPTGPGNPGAPDTPQAPKTRRRWVTPVIAVGALAVGAVVGAAGASGDPTSSPEYEVLASENAAVETEVNDLTGRIEAADAEIAGFESRKAELETRASELDARDAELDSREGDLVAREESVSATERRVAETQISNGIWTVGVDVEPGTYRVAEAVTSMCYWAILVTGTNGADIVENDLPNGGFPTVTLSEGQDFENNCGVWNKQ